MSETLRPGMFFLSQIGGWTGRWVAAAQAFVRGGSMWTHAGLILDQNQIIEGQPGGAKICSIDKLFTGRPLLVSDAPIQAHLAKHPEADEDDVRRRVVAAARRLEGTPYSFLDYLALFMAEWQIPGWKLLRDRVESSQRLICSALVDRAYSWAGIRLYDDGRVSGDVTPGDLDAYDDDYLLRRDQA